MVYSMYYNGCTQYRTGFHFIFKCQANARCKEFENHCREFNLPLWKVPKLVSTRWNCLYEILVVAY